MVDPTAYFLCLFIIPLFAIALIALMNMWDIFREFLKNVRSVKFLALLIGTVSVVCGSLVSGWLARFINYIGLLR
jgi:hypothetical protein